MTTVSVITVSYNSAETIRDTIESVRRQTYPHIEYIIVDGGSTDGTVDIIKENEEVIDRWVSEPDEGIYDAMNKGIHAASGQLIGILNSDDLYLPHTVDLVVQAYDEFSEPCVVHGDMIKFDSHGRETYHEGDLTDLGSLNFQLNHPTCFVAHTVYERHGGFDTWFEIGADRELMLRLDNATVPRVHVNKTLAHFRLGGATSSSTLSDAVWLSWQNWVMYRRHSVPIKNAVVDVCCNFFRRLAKSVLPLQQLRRIKEFLLKTPIGRIVWRNESSSISP